MKVTKEVTVLIMNEYIEIGTSDVPDIKNLQISEHHIDVTAYDLSERWGISLAQSTITLKNITQKFLPSAVIPLARRYHTDRVFTRNTLQVQWSCDTINRRCKSTDGNQYAKEFSKKSHSDKV